LESFKRDLDLEQIKLRSLAVMVKRYETEIEKVRKLVLLDVSSREKLDQLELTLFETRQEWEVSRSRVAFLQRNIEQTKSFINTPMSAFASGEAGGSGGDLYSRYVAPKAGVIGRIEYNPNEIVYKTNSVLAINNPDSIHVVGYFDPREIGYIGKGVRVKLIFPDKTEGWGVIVKYYIATYALPEEFQKKYEPTTRSIVTIIALENNDTNMLQRFFKMTVKLEINKFFWERSHAEKAVEAQPAASKDDLPEPAGQGKDEPEYSAENPIPALDANASDSTGN
jgi:hypothetical protein